MGLEKTVKNLRQDRNTDRMKVLKNKMKTIT